MLVQGMESGEVCLCTEGKVRKRWVFLKEGMMGHEVYLLNEEIG